MKSNYQKGNTLRAHKKLLNQIIDAYDSPIVRFYCKSRFTIININILHILSLCLRGKRRVLDIGCGFGLFGCYFAATNPELEYVGIDLNPARIEMANQTAHRLNLSNINFYHGDAGNLQLDGQYDAVMMIDLLHHLVDPSKEKLLQSCTKHLAQDGRLIIKDVTTHPWHEIAFTWALDVLMTRGFSMWYWDEIKFITALDNYFDWVDTYPIADWLPYPHIVYLAEKALPLSEQA
jgi:2-polyprenyl-3-methyl-5-hydroxy-6-metoxy-1,4-benzoquinol methylase